MNYFRLLLLALMVSVLPYVHAQDGKVRNADYQNNSTLVYRSKAIVDNDALNFFAVYRCNYQYVPSGIARAIYWQGNGGGEYVVVRIVGTVKKVELVALRYSDGKLSERGISKSLAPVSDAIVVVDTYFTESWPNEKIRIYGYDGTVFEYEFNEKDLR